MRPESVIQISADPSEFDEWARSLRLLVSRIGFALDGYLATRPPLGGAAAEED